MTFAGGGVAVDTFAHWHDLQESSGACTVAGGTAAARYSALLPAAPPREGEQYRFEVDLDSCTGCKACVSACHSLNGLDVDETWRSVGLLVGGGEPDLGDPWQQHVTTACHHCLEPACMAGCPVDAYEKHPVTGIVAHLDDQCIGCRYCMLTCPYEVPAFNARLGIVRKCDMCAGRLAEGEAPACVQGCPTNAISIGVVNTAELAAELATSPDERLVPTAPRSAHTAPTTVYITRKPIPEAPVAGDDHRVVPAHNHPPLVAMLVLTQLSVAAFAIAALAPALGLPLGLRRDLAAAVPATLAWLTSLVAIGASVLHLGRPLLAWRAVLGLRHSWLSREIVAFGAYAPLGGATAAAESGWLPSSWFPLLAAATVVAGLVGVVCSAQLYAVTSRPLWRLDRTILRFGFGALASGASLVATAVALAAALDGGSAERRGVAAVTDTMAWLVAVPVLIMLAATAWFLHRFRDDGGALGRTVRLTIGPLRGQLVAAASLAFGAATVAAVLAQSEVEPGVGAAGWAMVWLSVVAALWIERGLFFTAAAPDRMPGSFR